MKKQRHIGAETGSRKGDQGKSRLTILESGYLDEEEGFPNDFSPDGFSTSKRTD